MKNIFYLFVLILGLAFLTNCVEDDPVIINFDFVIGEKKDVNQFVETFNPPIELVAGYNTPSSASFDLNDDHIDDVEISSIFYGSPGGLHRKEAIVNIINSDFEIALSDVIDSTYCCLEIFGDTVYVNTFYSYDSLCNCPHEDSVSMGLNSYPRIYYYGDTLDDTEKWQSGEFFFTYLNTSSYGDYINQVLYVYHNIIYRGLWNNQEDKYLVFRYKRGNFWYYGWIKLTITNTNIIQIYEIAYQRP